MIRFTLAGKAHRVFAEWDFMFRLSRALSGGKDLYIRYEPTFIFTDPDRWN